MGKPPIPDGPTSITASWLRQALSAGVASDLPAIKEVDVEGVGAGVGLMGEVLRCRLTYEDDAPFAPDSVIVKLPSPHPKNLKMSKLLQLTSGNIPSTSASHLTSPFMLRPSTTEISRRSPTVSS